MKSLFLRTEFYISYSSEIRLCCCIMESWSGLLELFFCMFFFFPEMNYNESPTFNHLSLPK